VIVSDCLAGIIIEIMFFLGNLSKTRLNEILKILEIRKISKKKTISRSGHRELLFNITLKKYKI